MGNPFYAPVIMRAYRNAAGESILRVPERMVMDGKTEAEGYDKAATTSILPAHRAFARMASALLPSDRLEPLVADFGSGPARLLIMMRKAFERRRMRDGEGREMLTSLRPVIVGSELSDPMLELARRNIEAFDGRSNPLARGRIRVEKADCTQERFVGAHTNAQLATSLWLAHQLPTVDQTVAMLKLMVETSPTPDGSVLLVDFVRPPTERIVDMLVKHTGPGTPVTDLDYRNSLIAAFSAEEWEQIVRRVNELYTLAPLEMVVATDLPLLVAVYRSGANVFGDPVPNRLVESYEEAGLWDRAYARVIQAIMEHDLRKSGFQFL